MVDRTPEEPPPVVVAVVGPPGVNGLCNFRNLVGWQDYSHQKSCKEIYKAFTLTGHRTDNRHRAGRLVDSASSDHAPVAQCADLTLTPLLSSGSAR